MKVTLSAAWRPATRAQRAPGEPSPTAPRDRASTGLLRVRVLGLDLGTRCGWALAEAGVVVSGCWDLRPRRFEGGGMRLLRLRRYLEDLAPERVWFEEVRRHAGTDAAHVYGGLMGMVTAWCEERGVPYAGIPVQAVKRRATGKGNAGKAEMVEAARVAFHRADLVSEDEADALWVMQCGLDELVG